ncbi:MAG TPA: formyltransferase family protein [Thermoanaerobaculia bacterium]|nr:formyltransferase family protein [Thermoanaerobaculia bacterium]
MLTSSRILRVAVLASRRAPGLSDLLARRGSDYDIVCCLSSEESLAEASLLDAEGVPLVRHPIARFASAMGWNRFDLDRRPSYDRATARLLRPYRPDLLLLAGYLCIVTRPLLEAYPGRIVNVHGSDLSLRNKEGNPLYPGLRAVRDAVRAGEPETRASAHLVTETVDAGPILLRSPAFPVAPWVATLRRTGAHHALNAYAHAHQEWMLAAAWGPLLVASIRVLAQDFRRPEARALPVAAGWA